MRPVFAALLFAALLSPAAFSSGTSKVSDLEAHPFSADFPSGGQIRADIRSAGIKIVGRDDNRITVRVSGSSDSDKDVTLKFDRSGTYADLHIYGGPNHDLQITIEVPKLSGLLVRVPAGDVEIEGVTGDKDVELHAGDLTIAVGNAADYGRVSVSVTTGDISAEPFGENHSGMFRSFEKRGPGKYKLAAHLWAGEITLH
ncbi:MAG TPA: hypothetical protein VN862_10190 [Candidatus Acidoferrales bacterium]|nr:hypothetical protein [Candidatus Acidoferrales bacterium]